MKSHTLILISVFIHQILCSCSNYLSCFKSKLFNFDSPSENIYLLQDITNDNNLGNLNVMAYGDFNNDLHTDFVASIGGNTSIGIYIWSTDNAIFNLQQTISTTNCPVQSVFLYDMNLDGLLDMVLWGKSNDENCLLPFIQTSNSNSIFIAGANLTMPATSNPFVISYGPDNGVSRTIGLLIFMNGQRSILQYSNSNNNFTTIPWIKVFPEGGNYASVPFADPHWNSYLDLTGDCRGDIVIVDQNQNVQFWVNSNNTFTYLYSNTTDQLGNFVSMTFNDMNYDGVVDLILGYSDSIKIFYNPRILEYATDFCWYENTKVQFNISNTVILTFDSGTMSQGNLQLKDINIDGFPDILVPLNVGNGQTVQIYISNQGNGFASNDNYKLPVQQFTSLVSVSFIDFMENGIMDFMICTQKGSFAFYNNYLQQNLYFIKGYGASGASSSTGSQITGASFYWVNSVGQGYRTTFQAQIPQTAYNALQTPFAFCGLGRANNYVQSFTLAIFGQYSSWSPIIPNSQLAVYAPGSNQDDWAIRIYVLPKQSLVYVIIVSAIILILLGGVLAGLKCKNFRKKEEPLMEFIH